MAINQAVYRITKGDKFITLFVAELDLKSHRLLYINAGHFPPFLKYKNSLTRLEQGCTVIGAFENIDHIDLGECALEGEGMILTFTDGLTDLQNPKGQFFDESLIEKSLAKYQGHSAKEFNQSLLTQLEEFKGEMDYPDDIAVLTCNFHA